MDLSKFVAGMSVTLRVRRGSTVADFDTVLINCVKNVMICEPFTLEGKPVNFNISGISVDLIVMGENIGGVYTWHDVQVKLGNIKQTQICHFICLDTEPEISNRRNTFRQSIGIDAKATAFHRPTAKVYLKDVSNGGLGFVAYERGHFDLEKPVIVEFTDCDGRFEMSVGCKIIRERQLEGKKIEFGCVIVDPPQALSAYIAYKQMEERKKVVAQ